MTELKHSVLLFNEPLILYFLEEKKSDRTNRFGSTVFSPLEPVIVRCCVSSSPVGIVFPRLNAINPRYLGKRMAVIRTTTNMILREILHSQPYFSLSSPPIFSTTLHNPNAAFRFSLRDISFGRVLCAASDSAGAGGKVSSRLSQVQQLLQEAEERALSADSEPTPKITLGMSQARLRIEIQQN